MKVQEIIELIDFISKKKLEEVKIETEQIKLSIKKSAQAGKVIEQQVVSAPMQMPQIAPPQQAPAAAPAETKPKAEPTKEKNSGNDNHITVKAPMIGTFYRSSNPETPSFVEVGDKINVGDTICIIEAMKLFNEIESDVSGTVVKILAENASPVEFDQPLFVVDPS